MNYEEIVMNIIVNAGDGKSLAMTAIKEAKKGDIKKARTSMVEAKKAIGQAHKVQTSMIQAEAGGNKQDMSLLMVHAQDHLMTSLTIIDLAEEFIDLYEKLENK